MTASASTSRLRLGVLGWTAVVASQCGGLTEQVADGETGWLAPAGDAASLAD